MHSMSPETRYKIIEGNKLRKLQEVDEVCNEVIKRGISWQSAKVSRREVQGLGSVYTVRQFSQTLQCFRYLFTRSEVEGNIPNMSWGYGGNLD